MLRFSLRNLVRKKLRALFTIIALAVLVIAFVLIRAVQTAWYSTINLSHTDRVVVQDSISYAVLLPKHYVDEVAKLPHVRQVTFWNWLGGRDPAHETEFFPTLAIDEQHYFDVFSELVISDSVRASWREKKDAAIVGELLAAKMGWKVGDRVSLVSGFYTEQPLWQFEIVGFYGVTGRTFNRSVLFVRWDYFNELAASWHNDKIGWISTHFDDPARSADVASSIDAHFSDHGQQTFTQNERAFNASFADGMNAMMTALNIACLALLGIMVLLIGNTIAMGVRERTQEYGTLRAIGFAPRQIALSIVGEAIALGGLGGLVGLGLSYPLVDRGLGAWMGKNMDAFLPYFEVGATTALLAFLAALAVSALAASMPAYRIFHLSVTTALRRIA